MAASKLVSSSMPDFRKRNQYYCKAMTINLSFGTEVMRDLLKKYLKGSTLQYHLTNRITSQLKVLKKKDIKEILKDPDIGKLELAQLAKLLIHSFKLTNDDKENIGKLRKLRNTLAHSPKAELNDISIFNESSQIILALAKSASTGNPVHKNYIADMTTKINKLRRSEQMIPCCDAGRILLNNEYYELKLVECEETSSSEGCYNSVLIKCGLTKYCKELATCIECVDDFARTLVIDGIFGDELVQIVRESYSNEEKMQTLVLYICCNASDRDLRRIINEHLRKLPSGNLMASLVECRTDGKIQYEKYVQDIVFDVLKESVIKSDGSCLMSSVLHERVETELGQDIYFNVIEYCFRQTFNRDFENSSSVQGFKLKDEILIGSDTKLSPAAPEDKKNEKFREMKIDRFAIYVDRVLYKTRQECQSIFEKAVMDQSITPSIFKDMSSEDLKDVFAPYLPLGVVYGYGIKRQLMEIQNDIRLEYEKKPGPDNESVILRAFDQSPTYEYQRGVVIPVKGNVLVPIHEYRYPEHVVMMSQYVANEVIEFSAACINSRQNGTIHFGIKSINKSDGQIIGFPRNCIHLASIDSEIVKAINLCFEENNTVAQICVRPVQVIQVEDGKVVLEVDVVPFHKYLKRWQIPVNFPLKGKQYQRYLTHEKGGIISTKDSYFNDLASKILDERQHLEDKIESKYTGAVVQQTKLCGMLTEGKDYVTDFFCPVIVTGNISESENEQYIRQNLEIESAFISSKVVFDFDSSTKLLEKVEKKHESHFLVKKAEDITSKDENMLSDGTKPFWIFCNGHEKSPSEEERTQYDIKQWNSKGRRSGVQNAMAELRRYIPSPRCKIIFLVYQKYKLEGRDPMMEMARHAILDDFAEECMIVAEREDVVCEWRKEFEQILNDEVVNKLFVTGIPWELFSNTLTEKFHRSSETICLLPCADGSYCHLTKAELSEFKDITIVSGKECEHEINSMSQTSRAEINEQSQTNFYRGIGSSWMNFYFENQVAKRNCFDFHFNNVKDMLKGSKYGYFPTYTIKHYPGAGGSTLGKNLIWKLSQFQGKPKGKYRCCLLKNFTKSTTVRQIVNLRFCKESDDAKPKTVIVLLDNPDDDTLEEMDKELAKLSYKNATPDNVFILKLIINRVIPNSIISADQYTLTHQLSPREKEWFISKYQEMEKAFNKEYIDSLIAFNFMKESFSILVMQETTDRLLEGVTEAEKKVLKCLSLVGTFGIERNAIPVPVFDSLVGKQIDLETLSRLPPFGIVYSAKEREAMMPRKGIWNVTLSENMELLIANRDGPQDIKGVCILSQPLAKAILENIRKKEKVSLEKIVENLLELAQIHKNESNPGSKEFVHIVSRLFIERQKIYTPRNTDKGIEKHTRDQYDTNDTRDREKFSQLILELSQQKCESKDSTSTNVLRIVEKCFDITQDAMVGQQLARFNIHINDFGAAEKAIERSLRIKPMSSFLVDTFGQIFKSKMDFLLKKFEENRRPFSDEEAAEIFDMALKAHDKFREGKYFAVSEDKVNKADRNLSCFVNGIRVSLDLLESFSKFKCYTNHKTFRDYLCNERFAEEPFKCLEQLCDLNAIRRGSAFQHTLEDSLRYLQEKRYQIKLYNVSMDEGETLLTLSERYERMYGDEGRQQFEVRHGIGLKSLMCTINTEEHDSLSDRVQVAKENISNNIQGNIDTRDYLIYLGYNIIRLSDIRERENGQCSDETYKDMLLHTSCLIKKECNSSGKRLYLEAFLFHAMIHWPTEDRLSKWFDELCPPVKYQEYVKRWEKTFDKNHYLKTMEQKLKNKPKNFFALGNGTPGNDIVDLETIRHKWRDEKLSTGKRKMAPVRADDFWQEPFVKELLKRLKGVVNYDGKSISHEVLYVDNKKTFVISMYEPSPELCNREVSFVLGFTWKGPTALNVEKYEDKHNDDETESDFDGVFPNMEIGNKDELALFCDDAKHEQFSESESQDAPTASSKQVNENTRRRLSENNGITGKKNEPVQRSQKTKKTKKRHTHKCRRK